MDLHDVIKAVELIVSLERDPETNSQTIEEVSLSIIKSINEWNLSVDQELYKYLDDFDIRRSDAKYLEFQHNKMRELLKKMDVPMN